MANEQQAGVLVRGPGTGTSDSIPAALSDGELVIPADDVRRYGAAHLMRMIKEMGSALPQPGMKEGVQHAADGGLVTDPFGPQTNDVTRVGNNYSGGNIGGAITVNGQAPGGTMSNVNPMTPAAPPPAAITPAPMAQPPAGFAVPAAPLPSAAPIGAPAPAAAPLRPIGMPTGGQTSWSSRPQLARPPAPPPPPAPGPLSAAARPQQFFSQGALGYAQGGLVDERDLRRPLSGYAAPAEGAEVMGRRPPVYMGPVQEVPRTALPAPAGAGGAVVPAGSGADVIGRRPPVYMGAADVVQPSRLAGGPAPLSQAALPAAESAAARMPLSRAALGGAGAALGVGLEGKQVYDVATNPNSTGLDVASQAAQGAGRLGAAGAGAAGGAAAGAALGPVGAAVGGIIGGGVGYLAADKAIAAGRQLTGSDPRSPAEQLAAAAPAAPAAPTESGGAVFGIYPRPSSQRSTNANDAALQRGVQATGPSTFVPAAAAVATPEAAPQRLNNLTDPRSLEFQGGAAGAPAGAALGEPLVDAMTGAAVTPPAGAAPAQDPNLPAGVTRTGNSFTGANVGSPAGAGPGALGGGEDTNARLARLQASNASVPQGGLTVMENPGPAAAQAMFDGAALRTAAARGSWSPRKGFQSDDGAIAAAALPLAQRAQQEATQAREQGANQRATFEQQGLAARARITDARQAEGNAIDRARLGIEAIRAGNSGVPSGYRVKADGTGLEPIPGGPTDPNTPRGKNTLNDTQAKALQFGSRMQASEGILDKLAAAGVNQPGMIKRGADAVGLGSAANWTQSPQQQQVEQAQRDFINAALRRESGAAIADSEFSNARQQYFPQPGDSTEVIAQKKRNRELATRGILAEVPDGEKRLTQVSAPDAAPAGAAPLPQGMSRQVGTSGGKPVYEDANGRRFF